MAHSPNPKGFQGTYVAGSQLPREPITKTEIVVSKFGVYLLSFSLIAADRASGKDRYIDDMGEAFFLVQHNDVRVRISRATLNLLLGIAIPQSRWEMADAGDDKNSYRVNLLPLG